MLEKIKQALGEELATQVEAKLTESKIELAVMNDATVVPISKFKEKEAALNEANNRITEVTASMEKLSNGTDDLEAIKQQLAQAKTEADEYKQDADKRILDFQKKSLLRAELIAKHADLDNIDLLETEFDLDKINLDESGKKIIGADDIIKPIQERRKSLFIQENIDGVPPSGNETPPNNTDYSKLSDEEYYKTKQEK